MVHLLVISSLLTIHHLPHNSLKQGATTEEYSFLLCLANGFVRGVMDSEFSSTNDNKLYTIQEKQLRYVQTEGVEDVVIHVLHTNPEPGVNPLTGSFN